MTCEVCGDGPKQGITLYRQNEKGVPGIWRCIIHTQQPVDPIVGNIVTVIERDNRDKPRDEQEKP